MSQGLVIFKGKRLNVQKKKKIFKTKAINHIKIIRTRGFNTRLMSDLFYKPLKYF